jgi:hypothetical protein
MMALVAAVAVAGLAALARAVASEGLDQQIMELRGLAAVAGLVPVDQMVARRTRLLQP